MPVLLRRSEIASALTQDDALKAAKAAFLALENNEAVMPERLATPVAPHEGTHLSMPVYVRTQEREVLCTKIATVFNQNPQKGLPTTQAFLTLQDPETGELLALMDAEYLTALRTAAASALAIQLLSDPNADTLTLIGAGGQAAAHLDAILHVRPIKRVFVIATSLEHATTFCNARNLTTELIPTTDRQQAIESSQIIATTTNSQTPTFNGAWLRENATITAVGAFLPSMRELDQRTIDRSFVVVDRLEAAQRGAGDLIQANIDWKRVTTLGALLQSPQQIPRIQPKLFKSVGLAIQDAFLAALAYEKCPGTPFNLQD